MLTDIVNTEDIRVIERRNCPGFLVEPVQTLTVGNEGFWKNLQSNVASQPSIVGAIYFPHATSTQWRLNSVRPKL